LRAYEITLDQLIAEQVLPQAEDENWHEIIPLIAALLGEEGPTLAGKMIDALNPSAAVVREHRIRVGLAFRAFAELEARHLPRIAAVAERLVVGLREWIVQGSDLDLLFDDAAILSERMIVAALESVGRDWPQRERILAGANLEAVNRSAQDGLPHPVLEALLRSVLGDLEAVHALMHIKSATPVRALALAALIRNSSPDPSTIRVLCDCAQNDPEPDLRARALTALVQHATDAPHTLRVLRHRAQHDPEPHQRAEALSALVRHAPSGPETLHVLHDRAQYDPKPEPRALFALGQQAAIGLDTISVLRDRAENDPEPHPRAQALSALARHAADDADLLRFVRHRAENGPEPHPRAQALSALARHAADDPDLLRFVRHRAKNDPEPSPRAWALESLARYAGGNRDTLCFVRERAHADVDGSVRGAGLLGWVRTGTQYSDGLLASRDLNGTMPGLNLSVAIDNDRVRRVAERLGITKEEVRARYEALAREFPLHLAWRKP
jgi:hypothetical protein